MEHLRIRLFGGLEIHRGDLLLPSFPTKISERLFAYLVLQRDRLIHRDVLCGEFWGEQTDTEARKALRTALWRIRSVLEPAESQRGRFLRVEGPLVGFAGVGEAWVDTAAFEECVQVPGLNAHGTLGGPDAERLERAAGLYRGDFLQGHYDDWSARNRDRFRIIRLTGLERLVDHYRSARQWLEAIHWGRILLSEDPLREHIQRTVMASHLAMGDRPSALRQYQSCVRALREELDIEPMEETRVLHASILGEDGGESADLPHDRTRFRAASPGRGGRPVGSDLASEVESALRDLYALADRLETTRKALWAQESGAPELRLMRD